ncbi:MAG: hypothetical protein IKY38_00425, partial [Anaerotignum sp.]|nr:hypothetical protein [Anaerotignum sp.]
NKGMQDFGIPVNLILCCMRSDQNQAENMETIMVAEKYLGQGVCAVDLAGNEAAYPTESFKDVFALAKKKVCLWSSMRVKRLDLKVCGRLWNLVQSVLDMVSIPLKTKN